MNCPLEPEFIHDQHLDDNHKIHFKHKLLEKLWDKGIIDVAKVEWSNAAYTARYCTKNSLTKILNNMQKSVNFQNISE